MASFTDYSPWTRKLFNYYLAWNFKKNFSGIYCSGLSQLKEVSGPLLIIANHVSWWDGFLLFELQRRLRPRAKLYTVALKETCDQNPILSRMGVLPIEPGCAVSLRALLKHLSGLRAQPFSEQLMVVFFPQGKIMPSFATELEFQRGVEAIVQALDPITIAPVGIHIEPMIGKKPSAILKIEKPYSVSGSATAPFHEVQVKKALSEIHQSLLRSGEKMEAPFERWFS